ncbi:MAG: family 10 glycosylhydrolase [Chloroflexi bacterium]|nr:family 10 glycosylhydrolase [Chloroflexota bacterium]MCI0574707.1 family 10 glycosylhydrolase [Chloroflexota bacterium]MCI0647400.1 family 10 glycosylhydrolase [Chloroflexota bacterium]MCI0728879.1 family 10 glycosylhydrolase [Chloroflexota bacterium]
MRRIQLTVLLAACLAAGSLVAVAIAASRSGWFVYLPAIHRPEDPAMVEFRGLWVTRFDWTTAGQPASPAKIDEIVQNAAGAGFNAIFFQVRGAADAYYQPGPEPWAARINGALGQPPDPLWDPLAYFVQRAHEHGLQLHAYLNVYPVWDDCNNPPPNVTPPHFYYALQQAHGTTGGQLNGLQWDTNGDIHCSVYQQATPASIFADNHYLDVAQYLVDNYDIDGLHLDNIRYGGPNTSCDPVSAAASGVPCFSSPPVGYISYEDWQRDQINGTVFKFYDQVISQHPELWLSAAVWPIYIERPEWGWGGVATEGYSDYYQDSKGWLAGSYIDTITPMIYPAQYNCPYNGFWTLERWQILVADFQADHAGRFVIPGIGSGYCTFDEIANRINAARAIGTAGHAIFSYGALATNQYFDDLATGPYAVPAVPPDITWR